MAIRKRLKAKIKSLLGQSSTPSTSTPTTKPYVPKPTFEQPTVSTQTTSTVPTVDEPSTTPVDNEKQTQSALPTEEASASEIITPASSAPSEADISEATFTFEVVDLFPAECPHCEASSNNNWIRIENKFACGSCETAY